MEHLIRPAVAADIPVLLQLVHELAVYEREPDAVEATPDMLSAALFGPAPVASCHVAVVDGDVVGFALWYVTFSTWKGRPGLWLEDLFVRPAARGTGLGKALLTALAQVCVTRGYARFEWWVLDWNDSAIGFYRSLGAVPQEEWTTMRLDGEALEETGRMTSPVHHVTFDCRDAYGLAGFWAQALHGRLQDDDHPGDEEVLVTYPGGTPLLFIQVPEPKAVKNRVHLDLKPRLPRAQEVDRLQGLGASVLADHTRPDGTGWIVMADPEGNEFCVERSASERGEAPVDTGERLGGLDRTADERTLLLAMLEWYREGVLNKVAGMAQADAAASPVRSGTSAAGLVKHLALVEDAWFTVNVGQRPMPEPWAAVDFDDDPDWEWRTARSEPLADSIAHYEQACARSREIVAPLDLDVTATSHHGRECSLRWVLLHMIEETARHLGHLDILRELADGTIGD